MFWKTIGGRAPKPKVFKKICALLFLSMKTLRLLKRLLSGRISVTLNKSFSLPIRSVIESLMLILYFSLKDW